MDREVDSGTSSNRRRGGGLRHWLFGAYTTACLAAQIWPVYDLLGNSVEPYVLGLPLSLAWVVGWVALTFFALVLYHHANERVGRG